MRRWSLVLACLVVPACGVDSVRQGPRTGEPGGDGKGDDGRPALNEEVCGDGVDNDRNGEVEEGCPCEPEEELSCWLGDEQMRDEGVCQSGVMVCQGDEATEFGRWGSCRHLIGPSAETCDGEDNDCNGIVDDDPDCGGDYECRTDPDCAEGQTCVEGACVGAGALRFTLTWDIPGDLDLHVVTPSGEEIDFLTVTADGGQLDRDDREGTGPENVFWDDAPPRGTYLACVVPFAVGGSVRYSLVVEKNGRQETHDGVLEPTGEPWSAECVRGSPYLAASIDVP